MKKSPILVALVATIIATPPARSEMCTLDVVPAATLLLPYFEVDLDAPPGEGVNTVFTLHNALPTPTIAHLAFWSDWSQPVLDFDIFLTGYDAQTVDLYDILVGRNIPVTADEQSDLATSPNTAPRAADPTSSCDGTDDSCSPHGRPDWDGTFDFDPPPFGAADCIDIFPWFINPLLSISTQERILAKLTGQPFEDACYGRNHGDNVARGYITIDNASRCSLLFPSDPGYFSDGATQGIASNVNQLWGDWTLIDPQNLATHAVDPLIHIEADDDFDSSSTPTNYTFYGRYTQSLGGIDNREPLGSAWGVSYVDAGPVVTDLVVWRDSTANNQEIDGYVCGVGPDWLPLDQTQITCFDQIENAVEICSGVGCLPLETQRLTFGAGDLTLPFTAGWCFLNLNIPNDSPTGDVDFPASPPGDVAQSWVGAVYRRGAAIAGGLRSSVRAHACQDVNPTIVLGGGGATP